MYFILNHQSLVTFLHKNGNKVKSCFVIYLHGMKYPITNAIHTLYYISRMKISLLLRQYIWLIDTIYRYGPISLADINAKWRKCYLSEGEDIARSTFNRHREAIQDMFGIDILCQRKGGNLYYVDNVKDIRGGIKKWMLDTISVGTIVNESKIMTSRILLENVPSGQEFLTLITQSMQNGHTLNMEYKQFDKDPRTVEVEPYCLKLYHQRWYMLARKIDREWLTIYALDRIQDLEETNNSFKMDKDFNAKEYFSDHFGVIKDQTPCEHVVLHASHTLANYYRTLPLHHTQKEVKTTDKYVEFTVDLCPTFDFRQEILSQMPSVEIIQPLWLREKIRETLEEALTSLR